MIDDALERETDQIVNSPGRMVFDSQYARCVVCIEKAQNFSVPGIKFCNGDRVVFLCGTCVANASRLIADGLCAQMSEMQSPRVIAAVRKEASNDALEKAASLPCLNGVDDCVECAKNSARIRAMKT